MKREVLREDKLRVDSRTAKNILNHFQNIQNTMAKKKAKKKTAKKKKTTKRKKKR